MSDVIVLIVSGLVGIATLIVSKWPPKFPCSTQPTGGRRGAGRVKGSEHGQIKQLDLLATRVVATKAIHMF